MFLIKEISLRKSERDAFEKKKKKKERKREKNAPTRASELELVFSWFILQLNFHLRCWSYIKLISGETRALAEIQNNVKFLKVVA